MSKVFSINELATNRRASAWREAVCETFVPLECSPQTSAPMHGWLEAGKLSNLSVARVQSSPQIVERKREQAAQADDAFVLLSLQLRGRSVVEQSGAQAVLTPGCLAFYDTTRPYKLTLPTNFEQIVLHMPRHLLENKTTAGLDHMAKRMSASDPFAQSILALAPQLLRIINSTQTHLAERTAAAAIELISLALESLTDATESRHKATKPNPAVSGDALVWRTRELIGRQLNDTDLNPTRLANQVHVSLRRLQEVFKDHGTTPSDCIWDMRLEFARSLLTSSLSAREPINIIAYRAGFGDVAHFSRRFKMRYELSPSEYRDSQTAHAGVDFDCTPQFPL